MSVLRIMNRSGDTTLTWTKGKNEAEVRAEFNKIIKSGYMAFRVDSPTSGAVIRRFDPEADTIIMTAPMVGG